MPNITCLITRPKHQADSLCQLIESAGGTCILFPTIEIIPLPNTTLPIQSALQQADKIIFVSTNAALPVLPNFSTPPSAPVFAIGRGTQKTLLLHGIEASIPQNDQFNSEGLLDLPELQAVQHQNIVIFSGKKGKTLLFETLQHRGAAVQYIPVYKRVKPKANFEPLLLTPIDCIISTSGENLKNLWAMAGRKHRDWLLKQQLLVISPTMKTLAENLGFLNPPLISANATDEAIFQTLMDWRIRQNT